MTRQQIAHDDARADTKNALIIVVVAGLLALAGALTLIALLIRGMRRPLDDLVQDGFEEIEHAVRTGETAMSLAFGMHGFEWLAEHPKWMLSRWRCERNVPRQRAS